jgi:hypothetical protein
MSTDSSLGSSSGSILIETEKEYQSVVLVVNQSINLCYCGSGGSGVGGDVVLSTGSSVISTGG